MKKYQFKSVKQFFLMEGKYLVGNEKEKVLLRVDYWGGKVDLVHMSGDLVDSEISTEAMNFGEKLLARKSRKNLVKQV